MKFVGLLLKNARRNKRRTALTILSVAVAIFLFASLRALLAGFSAAANASSSTRIVTIRSTSMMFQMPITHLEVIRSTPGVRDVTYASWFGGIYKDPANFFAQFAVDADSYLRVYPEVLLSDEEKQAFLADRTGALVGDGLARRYGFKVGDRIVLQVGIPLYGTQDYTFTIRGIYRAATDAVDNVSMLFHWKYLDERSIQHGQIGWFVARIDEPDRAAAIASAIDQHFANSANETKTDTEKAFQAAFVSMFGNLNLLISGIIFAVVITTLFVAGNTMAMSVRERTTEIALMRTLGFPARTIFLLVAGEALLIALVGGVIGGVAARLVVSGENLNVAGFVPPFHVTAGNLVIGVALGAAIGGAAGLIPATLAARTRIVDALRRVA